MLGQGVLTEWVCGDGAEADVTQTREARHTAQNGHREKSPNNRCRRVWRRGSPPTLSVGM